MILTGEGIHAEVRSGKISILPFDPDRLNPNSYDFKLGRTLLVYRKRTLDARARNSTRSITLDDDGFELRPNRIYLAHTVEHFSTQHYVPIFFAKSTVARLGLFVHVTSNLIDIGHRGQWTLQLHAVQPIRIYPDMLIGQATFWKPRGTIRLYSGKYQNSRGPIASRLNVVSEKGSR